MLQLFWVLIFLPIHLSFSASSDNEIKDFFSQLHLQKQIQWKLQKSTESEMLAVKSETPGLLTFQGGKMRLVFDKPENSELIFNGKKVWVVQYSKFKNRGPEVLTGNVTDKNSSVVFMKAFVSWVDFEKTFQIQKIEKLNDDWTIRLNPKSDKIQLKDMVLKIQPRPASITEISYTDEVGNQQKIKFSKTEINNIPKNFFNYQVPNDAKVTNL